MTWRRANNGRAMRAVYGRQPPANPGTEFVVSFAAAIIIGGLAIAITVGAANYAAVLHP